ncbi:MAG: LysM peptidoglycan-binding domain-containing protein [Anaerolineae bacterium]|nr:LysM peptidoglycan-binding domain-containing protein [Anaerolineae bacterium]
MALRKVAGVTILTLICLLLRVTAVSAQSGSVHVVQPGENLYRIALRYGVTVEALQAANNIGDVNRIYVGQRLIIPTAGSSGGSSVASGVHIVQRGENLFRIARRYGLTAQALAAANHITNPNRIYAGQRLVIPGHGSATPATPITPPSAGSYIVQRGDTLSAIALRFGMSMWALARANHISNPSLIYVGQVLHIPGSSAAPSPLVEGERWIDVDLSAQSLTAYQGNTPVRSTLVSTGLPSTPTPTGRYSIYAKYTSTPMSGPGYYFPNVPYTMYFYRGYALHGTYWHSNFGQPMSHGCINLPTSEAEWLFNWAPIGTLVNIHY